MAKRTDIFDVTVKSHEASFDFALEAQWDDNICVGSSVSGEIFPNFDVMEMITYVILEGEILADTLFVCSEGVAWESTYEEELGSIDDILKFTAVPKSK